MSELVRPLSYGTYPERTRNVAPGSTIYTDGLKSFAGLVEAGFKHVARIQPLRSELRKGAKSAVPLSHLPIKPLATSSSGSSAPTTV